VLEVYNVQRDGNMCNLIHAHFDTHNLIDNKTHFTSTAVRQESNTALIRAIKNAPVIIVKILLDRGAKIDIAEKVRCLSALQHTCSMW
jgi:ankyrin repeat protein